MMVEPTGVERVLAPEDILVSRTDPRGRLTYVNDSFLAVTGYRDVDLLGRRHDVIRHPDMPRAVLRLLRASLTARCVVFGYVVNLTADGSHYWALAHIRPSFDRRGTVIGYDATAQTAGAAALREVVPLYARLVQEEQRHLNAASAIDASTALLAAFLDDRGQTYDQLVWQLITQGEAA